MLTPLSILSLDQGPKYADVPPEPAHCPASIHRPAIPWRQLLVSIRIGVQTARFRIPAWRRNRST